MSPRLGSLAKVTFRAAVVTTALGCGGRVEEPEESDPVDTDTGGQSGAGGAANTGGRPTTFVSGGYGGMNVLNDDPAPPEATGGTITVEPDPPRVEDAGAPVTIYRASPPE